MFCPDSYGKEHSSFKFQQLQTDWWIGPAGGQSRFTFKQAYWRMSGCTRLGLEIIMSKRNNKLLIMYCGLLIMEYGYGAWNMEYGIWISD